MSTDAEQTDQQSLFGPVEIEDRTVPLDDIAPEQTGGASNRVRKSVETLGNLSTTLLKEIPDWEEKGSCRYEIIDGNRRVEAFREQDGMEKIHALVVPADANASAAQVAAMRLVRNENRSSNPIQEAKACKEILDEGGTVGAIAEQLDIPKQTVRKRLRLIDLPDVLFEAVEEEEVGHTVASRVANMTDDQQQRAVDLYEEEGKLTGKMVSEIGKARKQDALDEMGEDMFGPAVGGGLDDEDTPAGDAASQESVLEREFTNAASRALDGGISRDRLEELLDALPE